MRVSRRLAAMVILGALGSVPVRAQAPPPPPAALQSDRDAHETRRELMEVLRRQPPALVQILQLDPTLLGSPEYLATYPALGEFLRRHPEVARDPLFFLGTPEPAIPPRTPATELFRHLVEVFSVIGVTALVIGSLMWLIRTLIDYRRWSRLSKVQTEVHTKLLDRFATNEDLIGYMRSEAGSRFLQSAPIPLEPDTRAPGAPLSRILWSLQAGVLLVALGLGFRFVSGRVPAEITMPFAMLGVMAIALGLGFLVSAAVSYLLSRRLGLLPDQAAARPAEPAAHA